MGGTVGRQNDLKGADLLLGRGDRVPVFPDTGHEVRYLFDEAARRLQHELLDPARVPGHEELPCVRVELDGPLAAEQRELGTGALTLRDRVDGDDAGGSRFEAEQEEARVL